MTQIVFESVVLLLLLLLNGVLALAESPNRVLSTVQIGITLMSIVGGAFGRAPLAR